MYLTEDVPAYVVSTFGVDPNPARWAVVGLSEGGTCALDLVLRHPDRFMHIVDLSGDSAANAGTRTESIRNLFGGDARAYDAHDVLSLLDARPSRLITLYVAAGTRDARGRVAAQRVAEHARRAGLPTTLEMTPGGHNFHYWTRAWERAGPVVFSVLDGDS
jgi:S-formylglutathione hydrolase FrmB